MINLLKPIVLVFILSLFFFNSFALKSDKDQPIDISADSLQIDDSKNISIYEGNVDLVQGSLHIKADKITFYFNDNNDLLYIKMIGSPARLKQLNEEHKQITGHAQKMKYEDKSSILTLMGNAEFKSDKDQIQSNLIIVNTDNDSIQAGTKQANDRVHITILPKQKSSSK